MRPILWHYMITGAVGSATALALFLLLLYRAAGYQMPDRYIWNDRVQPEVSWWLIGVSTALAIGISIWYYRESAHGGMVRRWSPQLIFFGIVLLLGATFVVYVRLSRGPKDFTRAIICLDRSSGQTMWTCEGLAGRAGARGRTVTHASATPVTDGKRIYGYFGSDGLMCVSTAGQLLWKKTEPTFASKFGVGASPVVKDSVLTVLSDVAESTD